jgi:hypothetical protein
MPISKTIGEMKVVVVVAHVVADEIEAVAKRFVSVFNVLG